MRTIEEKLERNRLYMQKRRDKGLSPEQQAKDKECKRKYDKRKRAEGNYFILMPCKICGTPTQTKKYKEREHLRNGSIMCEECWKSKMRIITTKRMQNLTAEERSAIGKYGRSFVKNPADAVRKQWETIRASPVLYAKRAASTSRATKKVWENSSEEEKNRRIKILTNPIKRSKGSDRLKQMMVENNLYEGFVSEEPFCGFIPDEINHDLKIIVEYFGDLYHCNPKKYKDKEVYIKTIKRTVGEQRQRDRRRLACFYKKGYTVVIVWESDFIKQPDKALEIIRKEIERKETTTVYPK